MRFGALVEAEFAAHREMLAGAEAAAGASLVELIEVCTDTVRGGGKLMFFGNGGSAADAQHLATELTIRYRYDRPPIAAVALTTDTSTLTAGGNDLGFDGIFARQVAALGRPGDLALGLSTSGNSPNVVKALEQARELGIGAAAFSAGDGGRLAGLADPLVTVPAGSTARIQEMHILLGHILCHALEAELHPA